VVLASVTVFSVYAQGQFVGSKNSDVYHYPSCSSAKRITSANIIYFVDAQDAVNQDYRPCEICKPPLPAAVSPLATPTQASTQIPTLPPTPTPTIDATASSMPTPTPVPTSPVLTPAPSATPNTVTPIPTISPTTAPTPPPAVYANPTIAPDETIAPQPTTTIPELTPIIALMVLITISSTAIIHQRKQSSD